MQLAKDMADKPRTALIELKQQLTAAIRQELPLAVEREVAMHKITFALPEVRERIDRLFGN
jgi:polyketide biosynthesis enoyl-CoA hydratase PksI